MNSKKVSELIEKFKYSLIKGNTQQLVNDVVYDSRKAGSENVFVCIIGAVADGHKYIKSALEKGCRIFVVQKDIDELLDLKDLEDVTVIKTDNTRIALACMSAAIFDYPAKQLTMVGITGTKGKTTTSFVLRDILRNHGKNVGIIGTTGVYIKEEFFEINNTTPESYDIHRYLKMMLEKGIDTCIMEVSSQAFKLDRTYGIMFDYGIFTNMSPDHIGENEHKNYEEYVHCKSMLFKQCRYGIFNIDDKEAENMMKDAICDKHTYGFNECADLCIKDVDYIVKPGFIGIDFKTTGLLNEKFEVNTPGKFSAYNSAAAILTALLIGVDIEDIKEALLNTFVKGRVEPVKVSDKFTLLIDYAHNAMSMESLLTTIKEYNPKRIVSLFGCGGNRSKLRRYEMGEISGKYADLSIITADNSRFEDVMDIIEDIKIGINKTDGEYIVIPDRKEAIRYSIENAREGDIVLLLGKGHETYQEINGVKKHFDEREIIQEIVKKQ